MAWTEPNTAINANGVTPLISTSRSRRDGAAGVLLPVTRTESPLELRNILVRGKEQLDARFGAAPPLILKAGEIFRAAARSPDPIYRIQKGWACQYSALPQGRRAIIDIYLPGDIIGPDGPFRTRPADSVVALTSVEANVINAADGFDELMASQCSAFYVAWLLGHRQRRADRLLTAISCFDARGRLGMMLLDFYKRLRSRKLIAAGIYHLPLTQQHIGDYLGLTVVHVNRVLKSLRDNGVARLERNCVTILDLDRLILLARGVSDTSSKLDPNNAGGSENRKGDNADILAWAAPKG
jgi:CRP-like cAMP-binding protein